MDNKLTLRQIAPGLFNNSPQGQIQTQPQSDLDRAGAQKQFLQEQMSPDLSPKEKILRMIIQNGGLQKVDDTLGKVPQPDFSTLVKGLQNVLPQGQPPAQPQAQQPMQQTPVQSPAQVTNQAAQQIGGQIDPGQDVENDIDAIQKIRAKFGGVK